MEYRYCKKERCLVKVRGKQPRPKPEPLPPVQDALSTVIAALLSTCMLVGLWSLSRDNYVPPPHIAIPAPLPPEAWAGGEHE